MTAAVVFHRLAAKEYRSARDWYAQRSAQAAQQFTVAVDRAVDRIAQRTVSLPVLAEPNHYARVAGFPYVLVFRPLEPEIMIVLAVAHTSRRPGYWRRRK